MYLKLRTVCLILLPMKHLSRTSSDDYNYDYGKNGIETCAVIIKIPQIH